MANNCSYDLTAVSTSREALERLVKIMQYKDPEFYLYRVFDTWVGDFHEHKVKSDERLDDGTVVPRKISLWSVNISGNVAWSCHSWFDDSPGVKEPGKVQYVTFRELCPALGIAVEAYGDECGCEFQEHYACSRDGNVYVNQCVAWEDWIINSEDDLDNFIENSRDSDIVISKEFVDDVKKYLKEDEEDADIGVEAGGFTWITMSDEAIWGGEVKKWPVRHDARFRD